MYSRTRCRAQASQQGPSRLGAEVSSGPLFASAVGRWFEWRSRLAHAAQLGLPGFGGVDPLDVAESAAAVRSATNLRSISRISGSVVRSAASEHALARRRYSAASELMERLVSMSNSGTSHVWGPLPQPRPLYALVRPHCAK